MRIAVGMLPVKDDIDKAFGVYVEREQGDSFWAAVMDMIMSMLLPLHYYRLTYSA